MLTGFKEENVPQIWMFHFHLLYCTGYYIGILNILRFRFKILPVKLSRKSITQFELKYRFLAKTITSQTIVSCSSARAFVQARTNTLKLFTFKKFNRRLRSTSEQKKQEYSILIFTIIDPAHYVTWKTTIGSDGAWMRTIIYRFQPIIF